MRGRGREHGAVQVNHPCADLARGLCCVIVDRFIASTACLLAIMMLAVLLECRRRWCNDGAAEGAYQKQQQRKLALLSAPSHIIIVFFSSILLPNPCIYACSAQICLLIRPFHLIHPPSLPPSSLPKIVHYPLLTLRQRSLRHLHHKHVRRHGQEQRPHRHGCCWHCHCRRRRAEQTHALPHGDRDVGPRREVQWRGDARGGYPGFVWLLGAI